MRVRWPNLLVLLVAAALLLGCARFPARVANDNSEVLAGRQVLFDASTAIRDEWFHRQIHGATDYRTLFVDGQVAVRAVGQESASLLLRWVDVDPLRCSDFRWMWRVQELQRAADIRTLEGDDVAASLFLVFGEPVWPSDLKEIPTLRYVWTTDTVSPGDIVPNPNFPETVRNVVVRTGTEASRRWVVERRNIVEDYIQAFGAEPEDHIYIIALFTDNDETKQPVEAFYAWATLDCSSAG